MAPYEFTGSMTQMRTGINSAVVLLRRAAEFWPELLVIISVAGFAYIATNAPR